MLRFISYGESLVDFLPNARGPLRDVDTFTKTLGGAPTNVAVALARLGCNVALIGIVGDDEFGYYICESLSREGVDATFVSNTKRAKTGITFVTLDHNGDRSFLFFREPSADMTISPSDIDPDAFDQRDVMLMGSNLLTDEPARSATLRALELAEENGIEIAIDVNYRKHLWSDRNTAEQHIVSAVKRCHLVKVNEDELEFLANGRTAEALFDELSQFRTRALIVTLAENGAAVYTASGVTRVDAPHVDVIDTTGAGDGFIAGLLAGLSNASTKGSLFERIESIDGATWISILESACYVGSQVCTALGATPALPKLENLPDGMFQQGSS